MPANAIAGLIFAGLGLLSSTASAQSVWRHGMVEAKSDAGFTMMVAERGFAERRGLKLQIVHFKGDALALKALIAGELESYEGNPGGPMLAISRGAEIRTVGCYWPSLTYIIATKNTVGSVKDLKGKTFGLSSPGALPDLFARAVLESNGIAPADVTFAAMGSDADRFRAVSVGLIDAAAVSSEFTPMMPPMKLKVLVRAHDVTPDYIRFCTYMAPGTIASRGADAVKFLAAEIEALRHAMTDRADTLAVTRSVIKLKADDPRPGFVYDEVVRLNAVVPEMPIPAAKLQWMRDLLIRTGNLNSKIDLDKFVDGSVREKALALAGTANK